MQCRRNRLKGRMGVTAPANPFCSIRPVKNRTKTNRRLVMVEARTYPGLEPWLTDWRLLGRNLRWHRSPETRTFDTNELTTSVPARLFQLLKKSWPPQSDARAQQRRFVFAANKAANYGLVRLVAFAAYAHGCIVYNNVVLEMGWEFGNIRSLAVIHIYI